jgi:aminocarboxymuconate-semialdehyde decarboxylase
MIMGSDYPYPLGEVPEAGRMIAKDGRLEGFLSWRQRAEILAGNALRFLNLDKDEKWKGLMDERWRMFEKVYIK